MQSPSKRRQLIEKWMAGFSPFSRESVVRFRAPECLHHASPAPPGMKPWTNDQTRAFFEPWEGIVRRSTFNVKDWFDDEEQNKLAITFSQTVEFAVDLEPYSGNYAFIFHFNEAQDAITSFLEFIDTGNTIRLLEKVQQGRSMLGLPPLQLS
jgi:hypothetical protein